MNSSASSSVTPSTSSSSINSASSASSASEDKQKLAEEVKGKTSALKNLIAGGVGGVCAVLVGQPFDIVKVRLQTAPEGTYTGGMDVARKTFAKDGVSGFFKGMGSPLVGVTPMFAVSFWGYAMGKKLVYATTSGAPDRILGLGELAAAGAFSALPQALVAAPVERVKVVLQVSRPTPQYKGPIDVVSTLYKEGGVRSLFRGTIATIARDAPGSAAYFTAYEATKKALAKPGQSPADLNLLNTMIAGAAAGVAMWSIAIPPDTIKSRLQGAPQGTYTGFIDCATKLVKDKGPTALFKGLGPAMVRAVPANAATFLGYELALKAMNKAAPPTLEVTN
ncbi:mitochondrial carrier [Cystobasidium minutum MCA 4210]|uniref:mitochondrial carrier n=1 Tax=Cystobasidium minutum MCA 4210 TaxID=1397322 RepID=UPI0034CEDF64|eukprot:jgi/Rhomi1/142992/e_gw1.3.380.1